MPKSCCNCWNKCWNWSTSSFKNSYSPNESAYDKPVSDKFVMSPFVRPNTSSVDQVDSVSSEVLTVRSVDLCIQENGKAHRTGRFELMCRDIAVDGALPKLVVRRGQTFRLRVTCDRPYSRETDAISCIFTVANEEQPSHGHGTLVGVVVSNEFTDYYGEPNEWYAVIEAVHGDVLDIIIKPSVRAAVTQWKLDFDTKLLNEAASKSYSLIQPFYLLFNPWCKDDQVYLEEREHRGEYVLGDTTLIYRGSYNRVRPSVWKLGQYERDVLDCSLLLISTIGKVSATHRGDPVRIARALSAAVNSADDDGAILGNWTENFSDGTAPTKWVGSVDILQKYYKKRKPVKYGQCWVFAGALTTIFRAIGIPSRVVTTYVAAHDTQASLTVDYFVDDKGKVMEEMNSDSIWNYHVWNEVWMQRPDLGDGYEGWQAVDATPQEISDDLFRCGPASVAAVKLGEILKPYDNNFLYAEVNADKVFWRYGGPTQPLKLIRKDDTGIGLFISTKAVGKWTREDITSSYKYAEKSDEERVTMLKALKQANSAFSRYYLNEDFNEIYFHFELQDDIKIGEPFSVKLLIKNRSTEKPYTVNGTLNVETVHYTGRQRKAVKSIQFDEEVDADSRKIVELNVVFDEYYGKLIDQNAFNISCMATVKDTEYEYFAQDDFRVRKPDIKIKIDSAIVAKEPVQATLSLTNPLPISLRKGFFQVEGPGIDKTILLKQPLVAAGETIESEFTFTPPFAGRGSLVAKFYSKDLDDVDGFLAFEVQPRPEDVITNGNGHVADNNVIEIDASNIIP